jgi:hypothetical protein
MTTPDRVFLFMVAYFWSEKGDPTRYVDWDEERLRKLDPNFHHLWRNYLVFKKALDQHATEVAEANDPDGVAA